MDTSESPITPESGINHVISNYFRDLKELLFRPVTFFRRVPVSGGIAHPLAFALVTHWLGSAIHYLWTAVFQVGGPATFDRYMRMFGRGDEIDTLSRNAQWMQAKQQIMSFFWGVGSVVIDPFTTLFSIFITSAFVYVGARIFIGRTETIEGLPAPRVADVDFESVLRIIAFGTCASIFAVVPLFGPAISWIYGLYIAIVGTREFYRVRTGRAAVVVLFPKLVVIGVVFSIIFILAFAMLKFFMMLAA